MVGRRAQGEIGKARHTMAMKIGAAARAISAPMPAQPPDHDHKGSDILLGLPPGPLENFPPLLEIYCSRSFASWNYPSPLD